MASQPEVTVIIPNYNGKKLLENCIQTLERQTCTDFKLLVVDNGSDDGSTEVTSSLDLTMLALKENTGFCGAVNEGIRRADTPYVILLNNDTEVLPEFVEELLAAIKKSDRIFSAGAMMIDYHDRGRIDNAGDYYTAFGWAVARGKGKPLADFNRPCRVFSCCGGAVIYRTGLLREMGPFDERHFAYLEDVDMGYRAKIHGYINCYAPGARVYHVGSATTGTRYNEKKVFLAARNSMYLIYKNRTFLHSRHPVIPAPIPLKYSPANPFFRKNRLLMRMPERISGRLISSCKKVRFSWKNLGNYALIQLALWGNVIRILAGR